MAEDIVLSVGVDTGEAVKSADSLSKKLENIFNRASGKKLSASTKSLLQQLDALDTRMQNIRESMSTLEGQKFENSELRKIGEELDVAKEKTDELKAKLAELDKQRAPTEEYKELTAELKQTYEDAKIVGEVLKGVRAGNAPDFVKEYYEKEFADLNTKFKETAAQLQHLHELGQDAVLPYERMKEYQELSAELDKAIAKEKELADSMEGVPQYISGAQTEEYQELGEELQNVINKIAVYKARLEETQDGAALSSNIYGWQGLGREIAQVAKFIVAVPIKTFIASVKILWSVLKSVASAAWNAAKNLAKMCAGAIKSGISKLGHSLFGLRGGVESANDGFKRGIKTFIKYAFGVRSIFFLIKRLRTLLLTGLQGLGDAYAPFGQTIQSFKNALNELKGAFISAFAPVASTIIPILNTLMSAITAVLNKIAMLFAALRGQTSYLKANVVPATEAAGSAASGAADAAEKYKKTLAGFDDVEILQAPTSSGGGGGGGGGGGSSQDSWTAEQLPIDSAIGDFASKLRELIQNQDWEGLGTFLGEKINQIFSIAKAYLDSYELINTIDTVTTAISTSLNSLVSTIDWELIGRTFGAGVNRLLELANQLMTKINWTEIGTSIGDGLNGLTKKVEWTEVGNFFSNKLNIWIDLLNGFASRFNWTEAASAVTTALNSFVSNIKWDEARTGIGNAITGALNAITTGIQGFNWYDTGVKIKEFIVGLPWSDIATSLFNAVGAALGGLTSFVWGLIEDAWNSVIDYWKEAAFEDGEFTISGLLDGIVNGLKNIGTWIKEHIFDPIINGFKSAFKIGSPSKVMEEQGGFISEGLLNGIKAGWESITTFFSNAVEGVKAFFKDPIGTIQVAVDAGVEKAKEIWNGIQDSTVVKTLKETGSEAIKTVKEKIWEPLTNSNAVKTLSETGSNVIEKAKEVWDGITNSEAVKTLKETGSNVIEKAKGIWESVTSGEAVKTLKEAGSSALQTIKENIWDKFKDEDATKSLVAQSKYTGNKTVSSVLLNVWDKFKNADVTKKLVATSKFTGNRTVSSVFNNVWKPFKDENVTKTLSATKDKSFTSNKETYDGWKDKNVSVTASANKFSNNLGTPTINVKANITELNGDKWGIWGRHSAKGGAFYSDKWHDIPQYASGTASAHGSMFIAGEAGPEIVGHVGGRTEVLNRSQLAATMYTSVLAAMTNVSQIIGRYIGNTIINSANAIIYAISNLQNSFTMPIPVTVTGEVAIPEIASGYIVPSMAQIATAQRSNDLLAKAIETLNRNQSDSLTNEELERIIERVIKRTMNIQFYIGDEQIARHANAGNNKLALRYNKG